MTLLILSWYVFLLGLGLGRQDQVQYTEEMEMFQDVDDDDPYLSREKLRYVEYDIRYYLGVI